MKKNISILKNFKKMMIINITIFIIFFIYCLPESIDIMFSSIFNLIILSLFMYSLIFQFKVNKFTGATEAFMSKKGSLLKYSAFAISVPMTILGVVCLIKLLITRDFEYEITIFGAIISLHSSLKSYELYSNEERNIVID